MRSLEALARYKPEVIFPGHGPVVTSAGRRIQFYISHRQDRERQVLEALEKGFTTVDEIVRYIYPRNLRRELLEAAGRNVQTHLSKLQQEGRVSAAASTYHLNLNDF